MKTSILLAAAILVAGLVGSSPADARQGGHGFGGGGSNMAAFKGGGRNFNIGAARINRGTFSGGQFRSFNKPSIAFAPRHAGRPFKGGTFNSFPRGVKHFNHAGSFGKRHHRRHSGLRFYGYGAPFFYDDYFYSNDYADDGCSVYWDRFLRTGNPKWKYRYYDCID